MRNLQAILSTLVAFVVTGLIVAAASSNGVYWNDISLFALFALVVYAVQWVVFLPSFFFW